MDNRIVLPGSRIDFNSVGLTGQDHDNYPMPQGQARYDHMRIFLIGLLAQQSSLSEPTQKRDGTPWFDLNTLSLKIWSENRWKNYSETILLDGSLTLQSWYESTSEALTSISPELYFSGSSTSVTSDIPIPTALQSQMKSDSRVFIYVNGALISPLEVQLIGSPNPTLIRLATVELEANDNFDVIVRRIPDSSFITTKTSAP